MYEFAYHKPPTVAAAAELYASCDDPVYLSGGHTLIPTLKQRLASPSDVIDLSGIPNLAGIKVSDSAVGIGALTPHAQVAASAEVQSAIPALARLAGLIGDAQVRNRGTLGGSVANSDPAADYPAGVLGLGATIRTDRRTIAADDYFQGLFQTALEPGELIVGIDFPVPRRAAYQKFPNPASRYAIVGVFVAEFAGSVRVAVTGAGPCAFRQIALERALQGDFSVGALSGLVVPADDLNVDLHASAQYRAHLVGVMARRAVAGMLG